MPREREGKIERQAGKVSDKHAMGEGENTMLLRASLAGLKARCCCVSQQTVFPSFRTRALMKKTEEEKT